MAKPAMTADEISKFKKLYNSEGADPNSVECDGYPPLFHAVVKKNYAKAKILIDAGADTCYEHQLGMSALDCAIHQTDIPMIQLLLKNGASFILHNSLITAINGNYVTIIAELIKLGADVNSPSSGSFTEFPIMCAIYNKSLEIFELLSDHGANLNITNSHGDTPLIKSIRMKTRPITQYLVEKKVDLDRKNHHNQTALSVARADNDLATVELLLKSGANPKLGKQNISKKDMTKPAITADEISSFKKRCNSKRADSNIVDPKGNSLLFNAVVEKNYDKAKALIHADADTCFIKHNGRSVLDHAIDQADIPMIQLLLENGASVFLNDSFITAIENNNVTIIPELIKLGADVKRPSSSFTEFPIMCAISKRNFKIFQLLSEHGANLNITDKYGDTPLIRSIRMRTLPITKYLLQKKIDLDRKDKTNETALSVALANNDFATVQLLLKSGANPELASEAIQAKIETNPSFANYMAKVQKTNSEKSQSGSFTGQEAAMK